MRTPLKMTLAAALPLASLLWMTPPAVAHDGYRHHRHRPAWSESYRRPADSRYYNNWDRRRWSESYRRPSYGRNSDWQRRRWSESYRRPSYGRYYNDWDRRRSYGSSWQYGGNSQKYNKAMNRLARQEREAQGKAYRRYEGNRSDPRFRERLSEIDRRYDRKRYQVERNLRND
jgi:hypothetical protein